MLCAACIVTPSPRAYHMMRNSNTKEIHLLFGELLLALVFAVSLRQLPLYSSNQNTYFVHGLANAGIGYLKFDWLSQTTDPVPVFSALVSTTTCVFGENTFYLYQIIIYGIYAYSILGIGSYIFRFDNLGIKHLSYFVLLVELHTGFLAHFLSMAPIFHSFAYSINPNGILTSGVAGQYILGPFFQPSVFGAFIILSIYFYLRDKYFLAVACLAFAATFHPTYLLSAGVLTGTYLISIVVKDRKYTKAFALCVAALVLVIPILTYSYLSFRPTGPNVYAQAQDILINYRMPHHAKVANWLGKEVFFQIAFVTLALYLVRKAKIFPVLLGSFLSAIILTFIQVLTGNKTLALLFPWRLSVFLVPIASSIIAASIISNAHRILQQSLSGNLTKLIQLVLSISSITVFALSLFHNLLSSISDQSVSGMKQFFALGFILLTASLTVPYWKQAYLVLLQARVMQVLKSTILAGIVLLGILGILHIARLLSTPKIGVNAFTAFVTSTYQPGNLYLIPHDLEWFRLAAKVPIFVDFKSHPYKDVELLEWFSRVEIAKNYYISSGDTACNILQEISSKYRITHVISKSPVSTCGVLHELYRDKDFILYEIQNR